MLALGVDVVVYGAKVSLSLSLFPYRTCELPELRVQRQPVRGQLLLLLLISPFGPRGQWPTHLPNEN